MNRVLVGVSLHSTVVAALRSAAAHATGPVDTRALLVELMRADSSGRWDRIQLHAGSPDAIARKAVSDPFGGASSNWNGVLLTGSCGAALDAAGRLAHRYQLWPLPAGVLALALVGDESSAAARALSGGDLDHAGLLDAVQSDVLGMRLSGIDSTLPIVLAEARHVFRAPPGRARPGPRAAVSSSKPWSARRRWTVAGLLAIVVAACLVLSYAFNARLLKAVEKPSLVANTKAVTFVGDMQDGCDKPRTYFPEMDPYTGSAPHPIANFYTSDIGPIDYVYVIGDKVPAHWELGGIRHDYDVHRVQLIACLGEASAGQHIRDCLFGGGDVLPFYQGIYHATLYEARTGRTIASETVLGKRDEVCPFIAPAHSKLHSTPDPDALRQALAKYVDQ
ncbi:hypothetical protein ACWCW7_35575 [Nocardia tengchongensis]